jgi:hypothetical protein
MSWKWDNANNGSDLQGGEMALDPVKLARIYFAGESFRDRYIRNLYRGINNPNPAYQRYQNVN